MSRSRVVMSRPSGSVPMSSCATEILRSLENDPLFLRSSERILLCKEQIRIAGEKIDQAEFRLQRDRFNEKMLQAVTKICLAAASSSKTKLINRDKLWKDFHECRVTFMKGLWQTFLQELELTVDPLIQQLVSETLMDTIIMSAVEGESELSSAPAPFVSRLTDEEENIIRYAAGYVPFALLKKHKKIPQQKAPFLPSVSVDWRWEDTSFLEYRKHWIKDVNRGGLFELNDDGYLLFREIKLATRNDLAITLLSPSQAAESEKKETIISRALSIPAILRHWELLTADFDSECMRELLEAIVEKWLVIRGFSIAGHWLELYKSVTKSIPSAMSHRKSITN